jgi:uncharacterized protein YgiB involved in biofilm formation
MSRMGREFSLVLLGAGVLTAGYFVARSPEEELAQKADEQAAQQVHSGGSSHHHRHYGGFIILPLHSPAYTSSYGGGRSPAMSTVSRGGFGGSSHATAGG